MVRSRQHASTVGGLDSSTIYYVRVIDPVTIQLFTSKADASAGAADIPLTAIENGNIIDTSKITAHGSTFSTGDLVTYQAPVPVQFSTGTVNVSYQTDSHGNITKFSDGNVFHDSSSAYNIFLGQDTNGDGIPDVGHDFQTGDAVFYHSDDPNNVVSGLTNDHIYYVISVDKWSIQLAANPGDTVSHDDGHGHVTPVNPIHLGDDKTSKPNGVTVRQFLHANPLGALQDGHTYKVINVQNGTFQLADVNGNTALDLSTSQTGGIHQLHKAGIALTRR